MNPVAALATLAIAALTGLVVHLRARRYGADERGDPETAGNLRRLQRVGVVAGWLVGTAVGLGFDTPTTGTALVAGVAPWLGAAAAGAVGTGLALAVPAVLAALAARLGALPLQRTVERLTPTYGEVLRFELERATASVVGLSLAALVVAVVPDGWPRIGAAVALGAGATLGTPAWLVLTHRARRPTGAETAAVAAALPDSVSLLVVEGGPAGLSAVAAGVAPGPRYVFVDATLFALLGDAEVRAVVAHEVGHHRHGHVAARYALLVGAVVPLLAVAEFAPSLLVPVLPVVAVYGLGALVAVRRMELTADDHALANGGAALADSLETLLGLGYLRAAAGGPARLLAVHPPLIDRIERARSTDGQTGQ
ncbi:M48 family metalloprotease [Haloarcula onubensis]|uniref:M48 family metalloprotease n=1 Tax=Haloarcula onubensis TaxID=2950539 RepID=A0ABU2FQ80_9EURY|nr:M48 family metalloprotease [Halomicroarcula sp. S3CR25-11]MDS0282351.1 M48 family metalloprotease [Halomicroarcula sp. S3CR25-11]